MFNREKIVVGDCQVCSEPTTDFCPRCRKPCHEKHINTDKKLALCKVPFDKIGL